MKGLPATGSEKGLVEILQLAHSGELAAALAYAGHWRSVRDRREREHIRTVEQEELHHRKLVAGMLSGLGVEPKPAREQRARRIGRALGFACHASGWLAPMYGAGKLESRNIREYELAARLARNCGREEWVECLLAMAEVEWEHERYFREKVLSHPLGRYLPLWPKPESKPSIRDRFLEQTRPSAGPATCEAQADFQR